MSIAKPISISKPLDSLDQKPQAFSRLTKKELEDIHIASTHYPPQKQSAANARYPSGKASSHAEQQASKVAITDSLGHLEKDVNRTEDQAAKGLLGAKDQDDLHFYHEKEAPVENNFDDVDPVSDETHRDHLPSASSLVGGVAALIAEAKLFFQPDKPSLFLDDDFSLSSIAPVFQNQELASVKQSLSSADEISSLDVSSPSSDSADSAVVATSAVHQEDQGTLLSRLGTAAGILVPSLDQKVLIDHVDPTLVESQSSVNVAKDRVMEHGDGIINDLDVDWDEQKEEVEVADQKVGRGEPRTSEGREKISTPRDAGDGTNFSDAQQEHIHETADKMGEKENEGSNLIMTKTLMNHAEITAATGSSGSSEAQQSDPVAAALRVTHLLDELTATVGRLRLESSDGKEMTIQLRPDVLADTNIHIVATGKQMEVSFLTSNATSNLLLNKHLTTLQNHLNSLCPGQVVNVQTQLTTSSGSPHTGGEQERSRDDLASFDQGNRGNNETREE
ncbi:MAG: hypothetical protein FJ390_04925 [Verrucomicrobia bacterium]|nr:hypothetical protein [Verrucomicrobiota bacterium]